MNNTYNKPYALSNLFPRLGEVKDIIHTELGKCFLHHLKSTANYDAVASCFYSSKDWICLDIYARGISGGHWGWVETYCEENISSMQNSVTQSIWTAFLQSLREQHLPFLPCDSNTGRDTPCKLRITLYDFEKRAHIGFFFSRVKDIQLYLRELYPDISFTVRFKDDDTSYYYLIFENPDVQRLAEETYGISRMITSVQDYCRAHDPLGIFADFSPVPEVTDKETLKAQGRVMGIMRDNPDFDTW